MVARVLESYSRRRRSARAISRALAQPGPDKARDEIQVETIMLKNEIERLTADLVMTRRRLRAERYRTRRLVDMISKQVRLDKLAKKPARALVRDESLGELLGESVEALAVLVAQQRFKSQNQVH